MCAFIFVLFRNLILWVPKYKYWYFNWFYANYTHYFGLEQSMPEPQRGWSQELKSHQVPGHFCIFSLLLCLHDLSFLWKYSVLFTCLTVWLSACSLVNLVLDGNARIAALSPSLLIFISSMPVTHCHYWVSYAYSDYRQSSWLTSGFIIWVWKALQPTQPAYRECTGFLWRVGGEKKIISSHQTVGIAYRWESSLFVCLYLVSSHFKEFSYSSC